MDLALRGKCVLVSGGSVGIGLAVAREFASEGADVALFARNEERARKEAVRISEDYGVRSYAVRCDVTQPDDILRATKKIFAEFGEPDILISNAGAGTSETIAEAPDDKWQYFFDLHVMASVRLARAVLPSMKRRHQGVIINTCSICARQPSWYEPIYNTTKAALVMFTKCLANEVIQDGIRVMGISPGLVLTPDWMNTARKLSQKNGMSPEQYLDTVAKENAPIGRFASPEEIAHTYVFLASEKASYNVGENYYVDGGWLKVTE